MRPQWLAVSSQSPLPQNIVKAGSTTLVGRALHEGEFIPASIDPTQPCAFVTKNGQIFKKLTYEVLLDNDYYTWQSCEWGFFPEIAKDFREHKRDPQMFIGYANYNGIICVGSVNPSQGVLHFAFEGVEVVCLRTYNVLVVDKSRNWISARCFFTPTDAVVGGYYKYRYSEGPIYVGRAIYDGTWYLANVVPNLSRAYIFHNNQEIYTRDYQVLCGSTYRWQKIFNEFIPPNAVTMGTSSMGEPLYIVRGEILRRHVLAIKYSKRKYITKEYGQKNDDYEVLVDDF